MATEPRTKANWAQIGVFVFLALFFLDWASDFLIPIIAALLGFLIMRPIERRMSRWGVPSAITAFLICAVAGVSLTFAAWNFSHPIAQLAEDLPEMINDLRRMPNAAADTLDKLGAAAKAAEDAVDSGDDTPAMEVKVVENTNFIGSLVASAPVMLGQIALTIVLMFFLISSGSSFVRKLVESLPRFADKRAAVGIVQQVEQKLGLYLGGITLINFCLGIVIGGAMALWGLPNPVMFGVIAFSLNFIPYVGAVFGALLASIVGFNVYNDAWTAILVFSTYMALTSIEGQLITPYVISNRLKLNPTVVFVTVAFFAWIWSVVGMVIAVPVLITVKVILDQSQSTRAAGIFLGGAGENTEVETEL
ncbi:AI-2E family transporter [Aliiroseovarius sediminis]|uniref:AI-2E family transporter n=1 Tax=Aliiroseovarius sediminis TaxID=2925839 RepID=UPI001F5693F4|nr:AI-2E family transporter [uncultured Aliiroseovarius sp.]MCI2394028.1 AI-2E family transporter [Aliiroseovarius sediminis]